MVSFAPLALSLCPSVMLSLIHISEPTRLGMISYAVFCLKKKTRRPGPFSPPQPLSPARSGESAGSECGAGKKRRRKEKEKRGGGRRCEGGSVRWRSGSRR